MKKIGALMLVIILFNFIFANSAFATDELDSGSFTKENFDSISEDGISSLETESGTQYKTVAASDSSTGSTMGMIASFFAPIFATVQSFLTMLSEKGGFYYTDSKFSAENTGMFTISSLIYGEYLLFNGKVYQTNLSLNPDIERDNIAVTMDNTKTLAARAFSTIRFATLGMSLLLFIYALIRLVTASSVMDIAVWKKVLGNWLVCVVFLFVVQILIVFLNTVNDMLMDLMWGIRTALENSSYENFEVYLVNLLSNSIDSASGMTFFGYTLEYAILVILQVLFFFKYVMRTLGLISLVILAPIFSTIQSFQIMSGKDSTLLKDWLKMYASLLFIQPIHALIYTFFLLSASQIAINAPLLGILFLYGLYRAEKIAKILLEMKDNIFSLMSSKSND